MLVGIEPFWFFIFAVAQGTILVADEVIFHWRRGLPRWERWGHPIDTFCFLLPLTLLWWRGEADLLYGVFAVVSCLVITKDERHHAELASGGEQWLHAFLFLLHPVVLIFATIPGVHESVAFPGLLIGVAILGLYQIGYWNFVRR